MFFKNISPEQILLSNCNDAILLIDELPTNYDFPLGKEFTEANLDLICTDAIWVILTAIAEMKPGVEMENSSSEFQFDKENCLKLSELKMERDMFVHEISQKELTLEAICQDTKLVSTMIRIAEALVVIRYRVSLVEISLRYQGVKPLEENEIPDFQGIDINALLENLNPKSAVAAA